MRKGEQTRQEIIRKAAPIFNQRGYDGAALSDLMQATGLEKGGIYRHFESKEQLAAEAFDYAWKLAIDTRFEGTQDVPNAVDRLKLFVRNFRDRRAGLVAGGCPLLNTAIDSANLAMLIVSTLEGSLMVSRLQRRNDGLDFVCRHLEEYLETNVRAKESKTGVKKS